MKKEVKCYVWSLSEEKDVEEKPYRLQVNFTDGRQTKKIQKTFEETGWEFSGQSSGSYQTFVFTKNFKDDKEVKKWSKSVDWPVYYVSRNDKETLWNKKS